LVFGVSFENFPSFFKIKIPILRITLVFKKNQNIVRQFLGLVGLIDFQIASFQGRFSQVDF